MAGIFALSIDPKTYEGNFSKDFFWGTFYQQHLGEDYCGVSTLKEGEIQIEPPQEGLFRPNFEEKMESFEGTEGIGYCGSAAEPFFIDSKIGKFSVCFSGNIINLSELVDEFKSFGHTFERGDDIEIITKLIAQGTDIVDGIKRMVKEIKGAYSLLVLTKEGIYAARCPSAHWPLVIGEKKGAVAAASESGGFANLGFRLVRDLRPGEIIFMRNGDWGEKDIIPGEKIQICSFVWVYTAFPNGIFEGIPASLVRKRLGAALARRDIEKGFIPDIVAPVPDSGRFHAIGYLQEFCRQMNEGRIDRVPLYDELLLKFPYAGRSFTPQDEERRKLEAYIKMLTSGEDYTDKVVVVDDDSIVRATQSSENLMPKIKSLGVKEIHYRISNPELFSHCPWGKTTKKGQLFASRLSSKEERIKFLGVESLEYNTIEDLVEAIGLPREGLCVDCDLRGE